MSYEADSLVKSFVWDRSSYAKRNFKDSFSNIRDIDLPEVKILTSGSSISTLDGIDMAKSFVLLTQQHIYIYTTL